MVGSGIDGTVGALLAARAVLLARKGRARATALVALTTVISAGGCVSLGRESVIFSPALVGQVSDVMGAPLEGIRVGVVTSPEGWGCRRFAASTTTDSAGTFELPPTRGDLPFVTLGHQGHPFQVCAGRNDKQHVVYGANVGYNEPPPTVTLTCVPSVKTEETENISCDSRVDHPMR